MKNILSYFRFYEWYDSKIPLAAAIGLYALIFEKQRLQSTSYLRWYGAYILFCIIYFSVNYLINDYSDMEEDRIAGKKKVVMQVNKKVTLGVLIILPIVGTALLYMASESKYSVFIMGIVVYILGISYSIKGIRMKERGIWGLIFSSFAQRNTPVLMVYAYLAMRIDHFACWMILCFANGLRYILIHQYLDKENDKKSGIHTFVADKNISIARGIQGALLLEILCLFWLFAGQWKITLLCSAIYVCVCYFNAFFVKYIIQASYLYSYACVPLEDLYNVYIPLVLSVVYAITNSRYLLIPFTLVYLGWPLGKRLFMLRMAVTKYYQKKKK